MSAEPPPEIVIWATDCQLAEPPETAGAVGTVRSMRTVACFQPDVKPAASTARKRTSVSPSSVTPSDEPAAGSDQTVPPSVEVSYSYPAIPEPGVSVDPAAEAVTDATFFHALELPLTDGSVGGVVSMRTVSCTHADAFPAASTASNRTSVSPSALTSAWRPVVAALHEPPPFVEVSKR